MSAILVLRDIDHTLIDNHGVNKETYALAFQLLTGCRAEHRARTDGRTDPGIMRDMLALHGMQATPDQVARMFGALEAATVANASGLRARGAPFGRANPGRGHAARRQGRRGRGARVVAVATGSDSAESLRAAGADVVLSDLRDTKAVVKAVTDLVS